MNQPFAHVCTTCGRRVEGHICARCEPVRRQRTRILEARRHARQPYRSCYRSPAYKRARKRAMARDSYRCTAVTAAGVCGLPATETHHIVSLARGGACADVANLASVCREHNPRGGRP